MIGTISTSILILLIVSAVMIALFIKPNTNVKSSSLPILRWNKTAITLAGTAGVPGNGTSQFNIPSDLRLDHANNMYIADLENHRVQKFLFGSSIGKVIAGNGTLGTSLSQLQRPARIYLDSTENFYITDTINCRVLFWPDGASYGTIIAGK